MSAVHIEEVEAFLEQHRPALLAYLEHAFGLNVADREDLAQEVCLRAYRAIAGGQLIQQEKLLPWLYRMTHNVAIDSWRHRTRLTMLPLLELESHQQDHFVTRIIERHEISAVLAQLPPSSAECLLFRYGYGYSVKELAQQQQVPSSLIRARLWRARRQFKALYRRRA